MAESPVAQSSFQGPASLVPAGAEECFATVDGVRMRYLRAGSGPALVLVHGLMGYSFSWRFTMPALARFHTVYAVDLPGAGFSDRPSDLDCRLRSCAERFLRYLREMGVSTFDLLGTSHGGALSMMAAALIAKRPEFSLRRLILVAPVNPWSRHGRRLAPLLGSPLGSALFMRAIAPRPSAHSLALRRLFGDPRRIPPGTLEGYSAPSHLPGFFEYALKIASHWTADLHDLAATLPEIAHYPTLLVWGSRDRAVYVDSAELLRKQFRECELKVFPGIGHLPYEEAADEFNEVVRQYLSR